MMIPQVARGLIQLYGEKDGFLFDPYCGTGTSLVEARVAGMDAAGTDLNPTARFIANAKTRDYDLELLQSDISEFLFGLKEVLTGVEDYTGFNEPECVTFERLEDWFPRRTIGEICTVMNAIGSIQSELNRMFLRIALSECLRLVSYQRNGEFKLYRISPEKREEFHEPLFPLLKKRIQRNLEGCISFGTQVDSTTSATIHGFNTVDDDGLELI
jgi:hypothetical protein